jgi:hypothetical protein
MSIVRVSFLLDTSQLGLGEDIAQGIVKGLLAPARLTHKSAIQAARLDGEVPADEKMARIAEGVRGMMLSLMAEANLTIEPMPDDTAVAMELPFERD